MPLPRASMSRMLLLLAPLLLIQHQIEYVEAEFGIIQTHLAELRLGLMTQHVTPVGPEGGDGLANDGVVARSVGVDEASVLDFALGGGIDPMDLGVCEGFEFLRKVHGQPMYIYVCSLNLAAHQDTELLCKSVDPRVPQQLFPRIVYFRHRRIDLERARVA